MSSTLIIGTPYRIGTYIDFHKYGMLTDRKFTVTTGDGETIKDCIYEGYGDLFSREGALVKYITHFTLQEK